MNFLSTILEIIFPSKCVSCGKNGSFLCLPCLANFPPAERENADWIFPLFDYRHPPIRNAIKLMKYKGRKSLAYIFAEVMHGRILEELSDLAVIENFKDAILIPIPLSAGRRRERGFNQAEEICKKLVKINCNADFVLEKNILIKIKETEHQARIENRNVRLKNIVGSFAIKNGASEKRIKNRNIILIDDVLTTGATLEEAKKTLKKAGAKKIIAFTVAH